MANVAVIGAQWGDEGKGKVVDWLASRADVVVRFQGGHNAGHTLVVGHETYKLSLLPSGLVRGKLGVIGNGVVIDPEALLAEIERVRAQGLAVTPETLYRRQCAADPAAAFRARPCPGRRARRTKNRHDGARHRPRLRGQDRAPRDPGCRPGGAADACRQTRRTAPASQHAARRPGREDVHEGSIARSPAGTRAARAAVRGAGVGTAR